VTAPVMTVKEFKGLCVKKMRIVASVDPALALITYIGIHLSMLIVFIYPNSRSSKQKTYGGALS
jgi:hypothetical protein